LTANADGSGSGWISSGASGIIYPYPFLNTGALAYDSGESVTLTASAETGGAVIWSGDCSSTSGNSTETATCTINNMNAARTVKATFSAASCSNPVRINGTSSFFSTIHDALDEVTNNQIIDMQQTEFTETGLALAPDFPIHLRGGYDCNFSSNAGWTTINGSLILRGGPVTFDNIIIR